mgnify:CR=1 FL=1
MIFRFLGFDKLVNWVVNEWINDIKKNQVTGLIGGVGPLNAVVQLCEYFSILTKVRYRDLGEEYSRFELDKCDF